MPEWIGQIRIVEEVELKLRLRHGLTGAQVRQAVGQGAADRLIWDDDPRYGSRLIAFGRDDHGTIEAYLRPVDRLDGTWECLTAWRHR